MHAKVVFPTPAAPRITAPRRARTAGRTAAIHDDLPFTARTPVNDRQGVCDAYYCGILYVALFDVQSYNVGGYDGQVTLTGYDNMTGVGPPAGQAFITGLRKLCR